MRSEPHRFGRSGRSEQLPTIPAVVSPRWASRYEDAAAAAASRHVLAENRASLTRGD